MKRRIGFPVRIGSTIVFKQVIRGIPPPLAQIKSSDKGNGVINHHDFLVLGRSHGMVTVKAEMNSFMRSPLQFVPWKKFALHGVYHGEIPTQQIYVKFFSRGRQAVKVRTQFDGVGAIVFVSYQSDIAVKIPPDDENTAASPTERLVKSAEIGLAVNDKRRSTGIHLLPAVS
jgi:hypothetical protein